jgi:hypothetical protein
MDQPQRVWHLRTDGTIGCLLQGRIAEPTELEAAEVLADGESTARMLVELDWRAT